MSKGKKTLLIVATTLVVSGCAISFGAFAAAGFDPVNLSTESRDWTPATKTFDPETENPHTAIVLRDAGENVRIEPTDGDAIEVTCWTNEQKRFDVTDDGGTITIKGSCESYIGIMMIGSFEDHTTVVKVPRSYAGTLDIDLVGGSMDVAAFGGGRRYRVGRRAAAHLHCARHLEGRSHCHLGRGYGQRGPGERARLATGGGSAHAQQDRYHDRPPVEDRSQCRSNHRA